MSEESRQARWTVPTWPLALLVAAYAVVSVVAWTDHPLPSRPARLGETERRGLELWRRHNCNVCHQIHGFGGFLGPDLTNRITDETHDTEFRSLLWEGRGRMPALRLSDEDQADVLAYLRSMNTTGRAQPRPLGPRGRVELRGQLAQTARTWEERHGAELPPGAARGRDLWTQTQCGSCHVPFAEGINRSPDLSAATIDRSPEALASVFLVSRGVMPTFDVSDEDTAALSAFLEWVAEHRGELAPIHAELVDLEPFSWAGLPWWEYE